MHARLCFFLPILFFMALKATISNHHCMDGRSENFFFCLTECNIDDLSCTFREEIFDNPKAALLV